MLPVLVSHFAQTQREQKEVGTLLLATLGSVSAVVLPIFACLYIVMDSAITLLYGTQWKSSVEPARILCIGAAGMSIAWVINSALSGMGKAKDYLRGQLFGQPTKLVLVVVGTYYSISHVASAIAFGDILILAYMVLISKKSLLSSGRPLFTTWLCQDPLPHVLQFLVSHSSPLPAEQETALSSQAVRLHRR